MFDAFTRRRALAVAVGALMAFGMMLSAGSAQAAGIPICGAWTDLGPDLSARTCVEAYASSLEVWTEIQNSTGGNQMVKIQQYLNGSDNKLGNCTLVVAVRGQEQCGRFWLERKTGFAQAKAVVQSDYASGVILLSPMVAT